MTNRGHLQPSTTVDKNGVTKTVYRKVETGVVDAVESRLKFVPQPPSSPDERVSELEEIGYRIPNHPEGWAKSEFNPDMLDVAVHILAKYERDTPLHEVFSAEYFNETAERDLVHYLRSLHKEWYDPESFINSERNLLAEYTSDPFNRALAQLVVRRGEPMGIGRVSAFAWQDEYMNERLAVVGVYSVDEDRWEEFNGTFDDEDESWSSTSGATAWVLYENGMTGKYRAQGDLTTMVKELLST